MCDLKVGDLVKLKSGSDLLTVDEIYQDSVIVVYFQENKQQFEVFKLNKETVLKVESLNLKGE